MLSGTLNNFGIQFNSLSQSVSPRASIKSALKLLAISLSASSAL